MPRWPILTLAGIGLAVLCGFIHTGFLRAAAVFDRYLACDEELAPVDPFGGDGYS